jgi:hypothetical protein
MPDQKPVFIQLICRQDRAMTKPHIPRTNENTKSVAYGSNLAAVRKYIESLPVGAEFVLSDISKETGIDIKKINQSVRTLQNVRQTRRLSRKNPGRPSIIWLKK